MARCFCGCGRQVALISSPTNNCGRRVMQVLARLETLARTPELRGFDEAHVRRFLESGWEACGELRDIAHGEAGAIEAGSRHAAHWLSLARGLEEEMHVMREAARLRGVPAVELGGPSRFRVSTPRPQPQTESHGAA